MAPKKRHPIKLTIVSASNLYNADWHKFKKSDPYCVVRIKGRENPNCTTNVVKDCLDPVWNSHVDIHDYELGDVLEFTIWDKDTYSEDDFLGRTDLSCAQWGHPDGFDGELAILEAKKKDGWLYVHVEPLPAEGEHEPTAARKQSIFGALSGRVHHVALNVRRNIPSFA
eukprot:CAMPEP_0179220706 /NCGR_PEP_ID=MMETSP0797-20121207/5779_1 /TAXON_ID=47934 /ORGANISM="Dinophysis acuminata, Strain DAEP01" /LENGTH=168 /DNA_ID=CAMNT_0020927397 /DNA_START=55 /DNA_END=561 /DNA_ORIENTATION=-